LTQNSLSGGQQEFLELLAQLKLRSTTRGFTTYRAKTQQWNNEKINKTANMKMFSSTLEVTFAKP
jgi:hypothetical protein